MKWNMCLIQYFINITNNSWKYLLEMSKILKTDTQHKLSTISKTILLYISAIENISCDPSCVTLLDEVSLQAATIMLIA